MVVVCGHLSFDECPRVNTTCGRPGYIGTFSKHERVAPSDATVNGGKLIEEALA